MNSSIFFRLIILGRITRKKLMAFFSLCLLILIILPQAGAHTLRKREFLGYFKSFLPPNTVPCNTDLPVPITSSNYNDLSVTVNTSGICALGCGVSNEENLIDVDEGNFAAATTLIGLGVDHALRVSDDTMGDYFVAGGYAGFLIGNSSILQADLLNAIVVRTFLDGALQESNTGTALEVIGSPLLTPDQYFVGFHTTSDHDAIEISIASLAGVLSTTNIYYAVSSSFCTGPSLTCNTPTYLAKPDFPVRVVEEHTGFSGISLGTVVDENSAIDSSLSTYTDIDFTLGVLATGNYAVKDELTNYPAQTYVGFDIENASVLALDLLNSITLNTYLDGTLQETRTGTFELISVDSGLLLTGTERSQVGFVTTMPFDEVQISIQQTLSLDLGSTRIYGLVVESFCENLLECSSATVLSNPSYPVIINNIRTGIDGIACVGCEVDNATNAISENNSDFATINVIAGVAGNAFISVENVLETFPAGSRAGFIIRDTNDLLEVDLLNSLTITTYLDGTVQEVETGSGLTALEALGLVAVTPSSTDGFVLVGFATTMEYDEIQLTISALTSVLNSIEVYGSYADNSIWIEGMITNETAIGASDGSLSTTVTGGTQPYEYLWTPGGETTSSISGLSSGVYGVTVMDANGCLSTAEFIIYTDGVQYPVPCNTEDPVAITTAGFTDLVITENTSGVCVAGCGILNENNIIDANLDNFATVTTLIGLGVTHTLMVTDTTTAEFFEAGGFAGFLIENSSVLQADLLNAIVVRTYLDGSLQEVSSSGNLIVLDSPILGQDAYHAGFYTAMDYDAIEISISSLAGVLSTTNVYHAVTSSFCAGPDLACNTPTVLTKPEFPVRIVDEHTGIGGALGVGSVSNTDNALDGNAGNYAAIDLLAGIAATGSIAIKDELATYPENTYAGFDIENISILNTQLFDAITVTTYLDGVQVESRTGVTELLPVHSGLLLTGSESVRIGFVTTAPFNEVQLTLTQTVSLNLGSTRVYGMVLEAFCEGIINCDEPYVLSNPNDSVIINNNRTGTDGLACVACEVDNPQHVISTDDSDYALINVVADVAGSASLSVQDVLLDYPAGTMAGFVIRDTNGLLEVDLLNSLDITTYLDGVQQEQQTSGGLLALDALGLIDITPTSTDGFYVVGFNTSLSFDEIRITVSSLVGLINSIEVYGGYIDATGTGFCQSAGIALIKIGTFNDSDGDGCSDVGETITYTFTVTNTGNSSITTVNLTDPLLGGALTLASGDIDSDNELDVTETWVYTSDYIITQSDIDAGSVSNQAMVTGVSTGGMDVSDLSDDDSILEDDSTVTLLCQSAGIALIKIGTFNDSDGDGCSDVGETITYTFTVTNTGNSSITTVNLTDPLLGGALTLASGDIDSDNELDVTETWIYNSDYAIVQTDIDTGSVSNQASVTGTSAGMDVSDLSDDDSVLGDETTVVDLCQTAGIALIKTGTFNDVNGDGCSDVGESLTYTFTVTNTGNVSIVNVNLTDPLLGGLLVLDSGDTDNDGELDVTEVWTYLSDYLILQLDIDLGSISNQATVVGVGLNGVDVIDLSDDDSELEDDITITPLCQSASIALIKTGTFNDGDGDGCSNAGETITYTFTVTNTGNSSITTVSLTDPLLGGVLALASGDMDSDNELDVTETWVYTSDYIITQSDIDTGSVSNQATVTGISTGGMDVSDLSDDDSILEDDSTVTLLCQSAGIALIKIGTFNDSDGDGCSDVGETITYTFTVTNTGNSSITTVNLTDPLLGGALTLASGDMDSDNELDVTETWVYTSDYIITQSDIDTGSVSNQAMVTGVSTGGMDVSDLSDDDSILEDDSTVTLLCQSAGIALIKIGTFNDSDGDGCSDVGETITYTFTVTNTGNGSIHTVTLADPLLGGTVALTSGDTDMDSELDTTETWVYQATYTITQDDIDFGDVVNQASVDGISSITGESVSDLSDDDSILEDDFTVTLLCSNNSISLEKTGVFNDENGSGAPQSGETITYSFVVYNTGDTTLYNITLEDGLPGIDIQGGLIPVLEPGQVDTSTFTATYAITQQDIDNLYVINQATVRGEDINGATVTDTSDDPNNFDDVDSNGDGEPDDPTITELPDLSDSDFEIFNAITPDEDGSNDYFIIVGIENYPNNNLKIYNRWGVLVYETNGYGINGNVFKGVSNGRATIEKNKELPTGTYFYILERRIRDQQILTNKGLLYIKHKKRD